MLCCVVAGCGAQLYGEIGKEARRGVVMEIHNNTYRTACKQMTHSGTQHNIVKTWCNQIRYRNKEYNIL